MRKGRAVSVLVALGLAVCLAGCTDKASSTESESEQTSVTDTNESESGQSEEANTSESETTSETETEPATESEEAKWFNEQFFNVEGNAIVNAFLNCEYTDVKDISLHDLFYDCPNQSTVEVSDAEITLLEKEWGGIYTDIHKVPGSYMDEMLSKYANIKLADTNKADLDQMLYLADYDAYYMMHGDTNHNSVTVLTVEEGENGIVKLQCLRNAAEETYEVTLQAHDEGYYFVSNVLIEK